MNLNRKFPQKRVIITGAGSGLGRALALEFSKQQWKVAIAEINPKGMKETAKMVVKAGGEPLEILCDVTKTADLKKALKALKKNWGGVDILINNAGVANAGYFENIPLDKWDWIISINLKSIIYGSRIFIPQFKEQGHGYIVNVASSAGIASLPEMGSYNVTKAGAISASETMRIELSPSNIGVSVVCPTFFKTNLMSHAHSWDERQRKMAEALFDKSKSSAEKVARHVLKCIEKNRLYVITQADGKFAWWAKRHYPEIYFKTMSFFYRKGYFDKYLGIEK